MTKLEQLKQIIDTALQGAGKSKLTNEVIDSVGGFTSPNIRHLMNNLGAISTHYLECGTHVGATLISTVFGNDDLQSAIGIDDFSLFDEGHQAKKDFIHHCEYYIPGRYKLLEKDYFWVTQDEVGEPIDLFLFDGAHDYESQRKGITYYAKLFADECIVCVDDFAWVEPQKGTWDGIREAGLKIEWAIVLDNGIRSSCTANGWWNGFFVALIKK